MCLQTVAESSNTYVPEAFEAGVGAGDGVCFNAVEAHHDVEHLPRALLHELHHLGGIVQYNGWQGVKRESTRGTKKKGGTTPHRQML